MIMKRDYKFLLSLTSSLTLTVSTLFVSRLAASEEVLIPASSNPPICPDQLEANKDPVTAATSSNEGSSSVNSPAVAPQTANEPSQTTEPGQMSEPSQTTGPNQNIPVLKPLASPSLEPPIATSSLSPKPLAESIIPASPALPPAAVPSPSPTPSEDLIPHTRYLAPPSPPDPSSVAVSTAAPERKLTLDSDSEGKPPELQVASGCVPAGNDAQNEVLPKPAEMENPTPSPKNDDIEKSIENAKRSLNGIHPF